MTGRRPAVRCLNGNYRKAAAGSRLRPAVSHTTPSPSDSPIIAAFTALYVPLRSGAFPTPGGVPILDLIAFENPHTHALHVPYYAAPSLAALSLACMAVGSRRPSGTRTPASALVSCAS